MQPCSPYDVHVTPGVNPTLGQGALCVPVLNSIHDAVLVVETIFRDPLKGMDLSRFAHVCVSIRMSNVWAIFAEVFRCVVLRIVCGNCVCFLFESHAVKCFVAWSRWSCQGQVFVADNAGHPPAKRGHDQDLEKLA